MSVNTSSLLEKLRLSQALLEDFYGAKTQLNVCDFVRFVRTAQCDESVNKNTSPAQLLLKQDPDQKNIDIALLLDRDIFSASHSQPHRSWSILFEEVSHFVYLCFNHHRDRNVSRLEMELQSEVDRVLLAHLMDGGLAEANVLDGIIQDLFENSYEDLERYEKGRQWAIKYFQKMTKINPREWSSKEYQSLRSFFHRDLSEKIHLLRG